RRNPYSLRYILERAVVLVVKELNTGRSRNGEIGEAIVVVIGRCTCNYIFKRVQPRRFGHVLKLATDVVIQRRPCGEKQVRLTVIVIIEEARSTPSIGISPIQSHRRGTCQSSLRRNVDELHRDRRTDFV